MVHIDNIDFVVLRYRKVQRLQKWGLVDQSKVAGTFDSHFMPHLNTCQC